MGLGGVQKKISDIVQELFRKYGKKVKITILLNQRNILDKNQALFEEEVKKKGALIFYDPMWQWKRFMFPYTLYAAMFVYWQKPDIILSFLHKHGIVALLVKHIFFWRRIKVIHGQDIPLSESLGSMYSNSETLQNRWKALVKFFYPRANFILVPSREVKTDLVSSFLVPKEKVFVIHNWVKKIPLPTSRKKVYDLVYVGRISAQKRLNLLVDAVQKIQSKRTNLRVCVIGHGELAKRTVEYASEKKVLAHFDFLGTRKSIFKYLQSAKIFILTSSYEGEPIAALEAMASGLPVVAMNYKGAKDLIKNGYNGFLVNTKNELVEKASLLLSSPLMRQKIGASARAYILKYHSSSNLNKFVSFLKP